MKVLIVFLAIAAISVQAEHECERTCIQGDERICHYEFHITEYHTLSRACFNCTDSVIDDCTREECVPADGVPRAFLAVNRQLPGPAIQVCEGDHVVVDVYNEMFAESETIHWHGQHQRGSQFMDGVPFVTQCPILPGVFRYSMPHLNTGTYWYHSHSGLHRGDGVMGALVVRRNNDPHLQQYDMDLHNHVLMLNDWTHVPMVAKYTGRHHGGMDDYASTILVNGKGRNTMAQKEGLDSIALPYEVVEVIPGQRHRLRFISGVAMNCPMIMSIDNHNFTIIATDGADTTPTIASSFTIYSGERFDIVLDANQEVDNYWIRLNGLIDCKQNSVYQGAILRYVGAPVEEPEEHLGYDTTYPPGIHVNPLNSGSHDGVLTMADMESLVSAGSSQDLALLPLTDKQFYLGFDFHKINNTHLYNPELYPYDKVSGDFQINTPQLNDISFRFPSSPPLSQPDDQVTFCRYEEDPPCNGDYCECTYLLEVDLGDTVEMILVDQGHIGDENHPFHLHGYNFYIVAMGRLGNETTVEEVKAHDELGLIERKFIEPVLKDSVTLPDGGYTIIRFTADNPGWWLMHCHLAFHSEIGMAALLNVGTKLHVPSKPHNFPTCGPFLPEYET